MQPASFSEKSHKKASTDVHNSPLLVLLHNQPQPAPSFQSLQVYEQKEGKKRNDQKISAWVHVPTGLSTLPFNVAD